MNRARTNETRRQLAYAKKWHAKLVRQAKAAGEDPDDWEEVHEASSEIARLKGRLLQQREIISARRRGVEYGD